MLEAPFLHNIMTQEHILAISFESDDLTKNFIDCSRNIERIS